jgi:acetyl/propionyl-CoA carboxylase alpha subunit
MHRALMEYSVGGIKTTLPFFRQIVNDLEFVAGNLDTAFIEGFKQRLAERNETKSNSDLSILAAALAGSTQSGATTDAKQDRRPSRWVTAKGFTRSY